MQQNQTQEGHAGHRMPSVTSENIRVLKISSWLTGVYFFIELGIGLYTGSIAVISDAFHTFSAAGGVLLALVAGRIAMKPSDSFKTYGLMRAEIIGALFNGFFLLIMAAVVLWMGYMRLFNPIELPTTPMFFAAFGGLITEVISIKLLFTAQKSNLNIRGAFWHILQTLAGSIIIIVAAVVIILFDFVLIDPILGMLFGVTLIFASWGIIKESLNILLETVPKDVDLEKVKNELLKISEIEDIHHLHAWAITSGKNIFSTHLKIRDTSKSQEVLKDVHKILNDEFKFYFSTVQIEKECTDSGKAKEIDITQNT